MSDSKTSSRFLSVPKEIRHLVWRAIQNGIDQKRRVTWDKKSPFEFASLSLTCRQLHNELKDYRPHHLIPQARFDDFIAQLAFDYQAKSRMQQYRSVTLQLYPVADSTGLFFKMLPRVLFALRQNLEELHLSFHGTDAYGVQTYLHGCGYAIDNGSREPKLEIYGQYTDDMIPAMREIERMTELRVLVLSNMNAQFFARTLLHKPKLEYFHITTDPRSVVHTYFVANDFLAAITIPAFVIPLKALCISANAMINANCLVSRCSRTLEHLTWTVPDAELGSNHHRNSPWFERTSSMMAHLQRHVTQLKTLRICLAGRGSFGHADGEELGSLHAGFTTHLSRMRELKNLEVHIGEQDTVFRWHFGEEIIKNLPHSVERFYTNDMTVMPRHLCKAITKKYLSCVVTPRTICHEEEHQLYGWSPKLSALQLKDQDFPEYRMSVPDKEQINMWIEPTGYHETQWKDNEEPLGRVITRSQPTKYTSNLFTNGFIGENLERDDYIPMQSGRLTFVGYQFKNPDHMCKTAGSDLVGESQTHLLLRLNGRLLDRARNKHLGILPANSHIPCEQTNESHQETETKSESLVYSILLHKLQEPQLSADEHRIAQEGAKKELAGSSLKDDERYFGNEDEAYEVFVRESVARPSNVKLAAYPCYVDVEQCEHCHFMCPEADVPTVAQLARREGY